MNGLEVKRLVGSDRELRVLIELARDSEVIELEVISKIVQSPKPGVHRVKVEPPTGAIQLSSTMGRRALAHPTDRTRTSVRQLHEEFCDIRDFLGARA